MTKPYENFKKGLEFLKRELTPSQYRAMQYIGIRPPSSLSEEKLGKPLTMVSCSSCFYLKQERVNND
ncbi:MAG: hypothetical protein HRU77_03570 [Gammaproteobacteria bacterium]|nr:hypothetical protein [Pseudomonadota bacterium]QOJ19850.1 MAG: hypothetical protein HRU77_03570 [Gammaproteobacteria bacterium]